MTKPMCLIKRKNKKKPPMWDSSTWFQTMSCHRLLSHLKPLALKYRVSQPKRFWMLLNPKVKNLSPKTQLDFRRKCPPKDGAGLVISQIPTSLSSTWNLLKGIVVNSKYHRQRPNFSSLLFFFLSKHVHSLSLSLSFLYKLLLQGQTSPIYIET